MESINLVIYKWEENIGKFFDIWPLSIKNVRYQANEASNIECLSFGKFSVSPLTRYFILSSFFSNFVRRARKSHWLPTVALLIVFRSFFDEISIVPRHDVSKKISTLISVIVVAVLMAKRDCGSTMWLNMCGLRL